jgi:hypothetical protein
MWFGSAARGLMRGKLSENKKNNLEARRGEGGMETNSSDTINLSGAERRKIVIVISNKYFAC